MLRLLFICFGIAGLIAWGVFYTWVMAMACAFGSPNTSHCRTKMPWELVGEDLMFLVVMPGLGIALLFGLAWLFGRAKS